MSQACKLQQQTTVPPPTTTKTTTSTTPTTTTNTNNNGLYASLKSSKRRLQICKWSLLLFNSAPDMNVGW